MSKKSFNVMLCDTFIDVLAESEDAALAEAKRRIISGEQELDLIAWETKGNQDEQP